MAAGGGPERAVVGDLYGDISRHVKYAPPESDVNSLVLGGTGFVGRRLVEILVAEGNPVTVLNRGVTPVELPPGVDRLVADRSDPASMQSRARGDPIGTRCSTSPGSSRSPAARMPARSPTCSPIALAATSTYPRRVLYHRPMIWPTAAHRDT